MYLLYVYIIRTGQSKLGKYILVKLFLPNAIMVHTYIINFHRNCISYINCLCETHNKCRMCTYLKEFNINKTSFMKFQYEYAINNGKKNLLISNSLLLNTIYFY